MQKFLREDDLDEPRASGGTDTKGNPGRLGIPEDCKVWIVVSEVVQTSYKTMLRIISTAARHCWIEDRLEHSEKILNISTWKSSCHSCEAVT